MKTALVFTLLLAGIPQNAGQDHKAQISQEEITQYLAKASGCSAGDITVNSLDHFDFAGDGIGQAIVVASTCNTGTAGPDIHAVFVRQPDQSLAEMKIHGANQGAGVLLGRVFYDLSAADGLLVETFHDTSGRNDPLVIRLRWNPRQREFETASVKAAQSYHTSFDCAKAKTDIENAVCYVQELAFLDVRMSGDYAQLQDQLEGADADNLIREQKEWLEKRNVICAPDWDISHCLETLYRARLLELEHYRDLHHLKPWVPRP